MGGGSGDSSSKNCQIDPEDIDGMMSNSLVDVDLTISQCSFPRAMSGIVGFRTERVDEIGGHTCRVHSIEGLQVRNIFFSCLCTAIV